MDKAAKLIKFNEIVLEDAQEKRIAIENEVNKKKEAALEKAEETILNEAYRFIRSRVTEIRSDFGRKISLHNIDSQKEIFTEREHYVNEVFEEIKSRLINFIKTEKYEEYLKNAYLEAQKALGQITRVYAAAFDMEKMKKIAAAAEIIEDPRILLGGFLAENESLITDYTFDKRFAAERERFSETNQLNID